MNSKDDYDHPLWNPDYPLNTARTDELTMVLQKWIWLRTPGAFIYGLPRVGKTFGLKYCARTLTTRTGGLLNLVYYSCHDDQAKTDRKFYSRLLLAMKQGLVYSHTAIQLYEQILGQFDDLSRRNRERQVILCIDEAQYLSRKELKWLISLHNDLYHHGIKMTVIQVGTLQLKERQAELSGAQDGHIKGRFFNSDHRFSGFKGIADLRSFLAIFDDDTVWQAAPAPSKRYFGNSPLAGTCLCDYAKEFVNVWRSCVEPAGREEWPSFYLIEAVRTFLLDYVPRICSGDEIEEHIAGAVKASGILSDDEWRSVQ